MNKTLFTTVIASVLTFAPNAFADDAAQENVTMRVLENAVYYDGYQEKIIYDKDKEDGILRLSNDIYAVKLTDEILDRLGDELTILFTLSPLCDNYDRVGNINIALVPKGSESYEYDKVERCEIARLITPFMDMNRKPKEVPYEYNVPAVSTLLRDASLREKYDFWLESVVFGVPYAANTQIVGCKDHNDVFSASIDFITSPVPAGAVTDHLLVPIYTKAPEVKGPVNLNNYREEATDTLKLTTRTFRFTIPEDVADGRITYITTSHGAGTNGEEYVRRQQLIYFNGDIVLSFKPGGEDCEPYRKYNTQSNGIYGRTVRKDWEEWSNWCPGQAVPIREIELGALKAGDYEVMIRVPDAVFYGKDGDIRPSLYFQGSKHGKLPSAGIDTVLAKGADFTFSRNGDIVSFIGDEPVTELTIHSYDGRLLYGAHKAVDSVDLSGFAPGAYILTLFTADGRSAFTKIVK